MRAICGDNVPLLSKRFGRKSICRGEATLGEPDPLTDNCVAKRKRQCLKTYKGEQNVEIDPHPDKQSHFASLGIPNSPT